MNTFLLAFKSKIMAQIKLQSVNLKDCKKMYFYIQFIVFRMETHIYVNLKYHF